MSQHSNFSDTPKPEWDAAGRTIDAEQAGGHDVEQITAIQLALVSMGYSLMDAAAPKTLDQCSAGDGVDGQWGTATSRAIGQFQDDTGIESTGRLDDETEEAILRAYDEALVAGGSEVLRDDELNAQQLHQPAPSVEPTARGTGLDTLRDDIESLAPGEPSDDPADPFLDATTDFEKQ